MPAIASHFWNEQNLDIKDKWDRDRKNSLCVWNLNPGIPYYKLPRVPAWPSSYQGPKQLSVSSPPRKPG